jgi:hypothetical protein
MHVSCPRCAQVLAVPGPGSFACPRCQNVVAIAVPAADRPLFPILGLAVSVPLAVVVVLMLLNDREWHHILGKLWLPVLLLAFALPVVSVLGAVRTYQKRLNVWRRSLRQPGDS